MSKILITGNGFDLFHHLPTKYNHFIAIMQTIEEFHLNQEISFSDLFGCHFKDRFPNDFQSIINNYDVEQIKFDNSKIKQIDELLKANLWYKYFKTVLEIETWIDFEMEIENILNQVSILLKSETTQSKKINQYRDVLINYSDFHLFGLIEFRFDSKEIISIPEKYLDKRKREIRGKDMIGDLARSFEDFIMIFNRYLVDVVSVFYSGLKLNLSIPFHLMDEIYTFNYTSSLESIYNIDKSKIVYLHGKIHEDCQKQNLVLGVSEILVEIKQLKAFDFTKYYQRIRKNTNRKFVEIPNKNTAYDEETFFYVIGHSLDKSDKEYILDLFTFLEQDQLNKSKIYVFYYDNYDKEGKIKNLLSIVDEKMISRMNRENRLCFVELNSENVEKEFKETLYKRQIVY